MGCGERKRRTSSHDDCIPASVTHVALRFKCGKIINILKNDLLAILPSVGSLIVNDGYDESSAQPSPRGNDDLEKHDEIRRSRVLDEDYKGWEVVIEVLQQGTPWRLTPSQAFKVLPTALRHGMNHQVLNCCIAAARQSYTTPANSSMLSQQDQPPPANCRTTGSPFPSLFDWIELADRLAFKALLLDCMSEIRRQGGTSTAAGPAALFRAALHSPHAHTMMQRLSAATSQQLILFLAGSPSGYKHSNVELRRSPCTACLSDNLLLSKSCIAGGAEATRFPAGIPRLGSVSGSNCIPTQHIVKVWKLRTSGPSHSGPKLPVVNTPSAQLHGHAGPVLSMHCDARLAAVTGADDGTALIWDLRQHVEDPDVPLAELKGNIQHHARGAAQSADEMTTLLHPSCNHTDPPLLHELNQDVPSCLHHGSEDLGRRDLPGWHSARQDPGDVHEVNPMGTLTGHDGGVTAALMISSHGRAITGSTDAIVKVWDCHTEQQVGSDLLGHQGPLTDLKVSLDGRILLSASADCTARLWDGRTGRCIRVLEGHSDKITSAGMPVDNA
ncbi:hypothetical protein CEUSTIGMA_g6359.t1 [Chlamydomonas eustigma]|uniref:Uncharacterized protein n=1 Tax=Chlamydomonas eustigma TaxID=1157962 RepID=A0A250X831_9CHLO|nr:hypothetical protein CEUSTIGMA_g6359.t1 [Chlamydomonas eustigma]|eukprot:GAX78920.1 hypothetical protein CEUSTIGMA_g6359.t1 [Chlamydomonas eustigma]